jgi:hypothetical protein
MFSKPLHLKSIHTQILAGILMITLLLVACGAAQAPSADSQVVREAAVDKQVEAMSAEAPDQIQNTAADPGGERIVIKNANLSLVVDDPAASMDAISRLADEMGGFVVAARVYQDQIESGAKVTRAEIAIRVPSEKLNDALARIRDESGQVPLSESIDSQDVTSDYIDLQSRLRNEQAAEAQLQTFMDQAKTTEEVMSVYNELVQVRQRIETLKGQIQYYEQSAALSSIQTQLVPNEAVQPLTIGGWKPSGDVKNAVQALINILKGLAVFVIWLVITILPVLLVLFIIFGLPILLIIWLIRRQKARRTPPTAPIIPSPPPNPPAV